MAVTPNTDVYLLKCPLELDNANQLNFSSKTTQYNYFASLPKIEAENFTYQRKDSVIRFPAHIDSLLEYNYVMYRNTNYGSKWFYAYITDMTYINDNMTAITIKTDVWQTWQFDLSFKKSFVEREHVADDTFGKHTVPEGLETGDYVCNGLAQKYIYAKANDANLAPVVLFQVTRTTLKADGQSDYTYPSATLGVHTGIPQGCACFGVRLKSANIGLIKSVCGVYDSYASADAIIAITLVPYTVTSWTTGTDTGGNSFLIPADTWSASAWLIDTITRNTTLDGYTPKNNKLFTKDYNYLYMSNNAGGDIDFHWEDFDDGDMDFQIAGALEQGGSIKIYPTNSIKSGQSASLTDGWTEGLQGAKLPALSWTSDYYLNWQAVNGTNMVVQSTIDSVQFGLSMLAQQGGSGINAIDFASSIAERMQRIKEAKLVPPQSKGNVSTGDINFSQGEAGFTWRKMSVRYEFAKQIDEYFSAFGYKVNLFKTPQYTSRTNWNYIKTKGIAIEATVPQNDLQEIKDMFNNGLTMWHNPSTFLDYSQSNNIV